MMKLLNAAVICSLAVPLCSGPAFCAPAFQVLSDRTISPAQFVPRVPAEKLSVPLALIVETGSQWAAPGVLEETLGKASAVFARCGLTLGETQVLTVRWTPAALQALNDSDPYFGPSQLHIIDETLIPRRRPAGFLFSDSIPAGASAYNVRSVNAFAHSGKPEVAKMLNTIWITSNWHSGKRGGPAARCGGLDCAGGNIAAGFSVFAHEAAHLFGNLEHVDITPNLMSTGETPGAISGNLTAGQCSEIVKLYGS